MLRVAMLSNWHVHAKDYAKQVQEHPEAEISVVWDNDVDRGKEFAKGLGVDFEPDLQKTLERADVDGVVVDTPTNLHKEVMIAAAQAGKHIFTEKVLAISTADAIEIGEAVEAAGVKLAISFPHRTHSHNLLAKQVVDDKLIGDITLLRIRNAHDGAVRNWLPAHFYNPEECGGGAMIDLGAHGMYLAAWLLGEPYRVSAIFNSITDKPVEDNAVAVIEFANRAIAINETAFVAGKSPFSLELYGTTGTLLVGGPNKEVQLFTQGEAGWIKPELPAALPSALEQWVGAILHGEEIHFGLPDAKQLTRLMEGAYISHQTGKHYAFK